MRSGRHLPARSFSLDQSDQAFLVFIRIMLVIELSSAALHQLPGKLNLAWRYVDMLLAILWNRAHFVEFSRGRITTTYSSWCIPAFATAASLTFPLCPPAVDKLSGRPPPE